MRVIICAIASVCIFIAMGLYCSQPGVAPVSEQDDGKNYEPLRKRMVEEQLKTRFDFDQQVLDAMGKVPRHMFVPENNKSYAYVDSPLPIGRGQTISQPFIVAYMTQLARVVEGESVLEIGTGSGYQAAVLAELTDKVYSIEIDCVLAETARKVLDLLGYEKVVSKCGDGYEGWPEYAPFDAVLVTAAAPRIPQPLKDQLKVGGILVIPVGKTDDIQILKVVTRTTEGFEEDDVDMVRFVPMTGKVREQNPR